MSTVASASACASAKQDSNKPEAMRELLPAPFFRYRDFSEVADPDPLTPLTFPGRVPNFTAKMHAILSRPDLSDIVAWMPHGRAWRILKPREFEVRVIVSKTSVIACWMAALGVRVILHSNRGGILIRLFLPSFCSPFTLSTASTLASSASQMVGGSEGSRKALTAMPTTTRSSFEDSLISARA